MVINAPLAATTAKEKNSLQPLKPLQPALNDVKLFQIHYNAESLSHCVPSVCELIDNSNATNEPFFENHIIQRLAPTIQPRTMYGVLSWRVKWKIKGGAEYLHKKALYTKADCLLRARRGNHWKAAEKWHSNFKAAALISLEEAGLPSMWYEREAWTSHYNYQICRGSIYKRYVDECLTPFMNAFDKLHVYEAAIKDAGYKSLSPNERERLKVITGVPHYPYHPFLAERLFGSWAWFNKIKVEVV